MDDTVPTRILLIDHNDTIHQDFRRVFLKDADEAMQFNLMSDATEPPRLHVPSRLYQIDSAFHGESGCIMAKQALDENLPYSLAFIDVPTQPGWDGISTIQRLWDLDPDLQIVVCGNALQAFENLHETLERKDSYLILKKPLDSLEIRQAAASLIKKWELTKQSKQYMQQLEGMIRQRTLELSQSVSVFKATLEATQEGILGIDINTCTINAYNKNLLNLWGLQENLFKQGDAHIIFEKMAEKTDNPALFLQQLSNLSNSIDSICTQWTLLSGRHLEVYIQNQHAVDGVGGYVFSFRDITRNKQLEAELLHQATHDTLTGLPNRALLQDRLQQAIAQTARSGLSVGILLLDIDKFKSINDTYGHACGDELLKIVSQKLNHFIQDSETATRLESDAFVLVLSRVKMESLVIKANELLNLFTTPVLVNGHSLNITISVGISAYPKDGQDLEVLLKHAHYALYQAKSLGKNTFQFYASEFSEYLRARELLIADLEIALKEKQFTIYYQPLINLVGKKIYGVETLLRWNHPVRGLLYPADFLDVIEESGLMPAIGEWVLRTACTQAKIWHENGHPDLSIAINISPTQFKQKNFLSIVKKIVEETGIKPSLLEFEITENLILTNSGEVVKKMHDLKKMGIKFSMDDFGTGYASLSYLKSFPFDKIKIDKSFVNGVMESRVDRSIIEAVLIMAQRIGVTVLAEGVSTEEELAFLKQHSAAECQGFYFSPAVSKDDCSRLLDDDQLFGDNKLR